MGVQNYKLLWQRCFGYWVMRAELSTARVMTKIILIIFDSCVGLSPLPLSSYTIQLWLPFKLWRRNKFRLDNIVCVNFCVLMSHLGGCHDLEIFHVRSPQQTQEYWVLIFLALDQTLAKWTMSDNWGTIEGSYDPMMTWIVECRHIKYNWDPMMWCERKYLHWLAAAAAHSGLQFKWVITISNAEEPRASLRPCKSLSSCTPLSWWGPTV